MANAINAPFLSAGKIYLTDGGLETTLIFHEATELPYFASFEQLRTLQGTSQLRRYFERYAQMAVRLRAGFVLESPTWRANRDWADKLRYSQRALVEANVRAIELMHEVRAAYATNESPMVISGNIGPRGDGYRIDSAMSTDAARRYHSEQIASLCSGGVDLVSAFTMNYTEEAMGVVLAAKEANVPVVISFTVETNGALPSGESLESAITRTDQASKGYPAYYMINCAHPTHFDGVLKPAAERHAPWIERIGGIRANASVLSHAELDESTEVDAGNPQELGSQYRYLRCLLPNMVVVGGCCGTDERHVHAMGCQLLPMGLAA